MTRNYCFRLFVILVAVGALAMLVGCKGGDACQRSEDNIPTAGPGTPGGGGGGSGGASGLEGQLLQLINDGREAKGLSRLQWDGQIAAVAENYCKWLASWIRNKGSSSPYSPTADGKGPRKRLEAGGVSFNKCGETGVLGDPRYLPPDVSTAQKAYAHLDKSKLNSSAYTRVGIGHHFEHFGG